MTGQDPSAVIEVAAGGVRLRFMRPVEPGPVEALMAASGRIHDGALLEGVAGRLFRPGLVLDLGANVGVHSLFFAAVMGRRVIAWEPRDALRDRLVRNLALNGLTGAVRVETMPAAALFPAEPVALVRIALERGLRDDGTPDRKPGGITVGTAGSTADASGPDAVLGGLAALLARDRPDLCLSGGDAAAVDLVAARLAALDYRPVRRLSPGRVPTRGMASDAGAGPGPDEEAGTYWSCARHPPAKQAPGTAGTADENRVASAEGLAREVDRLGLALAGAERRIGALAREMRALDRTALEIRHATCGPGTRSALGAAIARDIETAALSPRESFALPFRIGRHLYRAWRRRASGAALPRAQSPAGGALSERVSVIMTSFNSATYLDEAIRSVLSQSYRNIDLVVVDDASTDDSHAVALAFAARDARVRAIRLGRNVGTYCAKNIGLLVSGGAYFATHDSDDRSHPDWLAVLRGLLETTPGAVVATCAYTRVDGAGDLLTNRGAEIRPALMAPVCRRAPLLDRIGFFDSVRVGADAEYQKRIDAAFGRKCRAHVDLPLYAALVRDGQLTQLIGVKSQTDAVLGDTMLTHPDRYRYGRAMAVWHRRIAAGTAQPYLAFPPAERPFDAPAALLSDPGPDPSALIVADVAGSG
ncbi:MAG: glycosyltransferase [Pseudomonadota bacterium]